MNYIRLSPFSSGPLTEAGLFLRLEGKTLDGIHISTGFARDAPPPHEVCANEHRYELPGITVARKKFLLGMADPFFGFWYTTTTADPQPSISLGGNCQECWIGSTRAEPRTSTLAYRNVCSFAFIMRPSRSSGTSSDPTVESAPRVLRRYLKLYGVVL